MSDQSTHPDEPDPIPAASPDPSSARAAAPAPPWVEESIAELPRGTRPAGPRDIRRGYRPRGMLAVATGVIGLMIGVLIGAAGVVLVGAVVRHTHHGHGFRGDDRADHRRDDRPFPGPGRMNPGPVG